ncbi:translation elongation factor 4 [Candidatus Shikimatogenerans bostrichidophilus]|uniref:translation elongation factor 4 n=1 Tax=Candidatus Shikimatogenerans bostrichidophilus TaxID=2943807 RepID=UPI002966B350
MKLIRNFCIIAHIDHGKSTLAYRILKFTKTIKNNKKKLLDNMELEIEKGITIKNHIVQIKYKYKNNIYTLNLIDTPGHVDFSYEVYKSILACEGALLLIDISKNIQAQTISNFNFAIKKNKCIIPVLNKIDLNINYDNVIKDVKKLLKCSDKDIVHISAKKGIGIEKLIKIIIEKIPSPNGNIKLPLKAFIIDSYYDNYKGIKVYFRIFNGILKINDEIKFLSNKKIIKIDNLGLLQNNNNNNKIYAGNVGYFIYKTKNLEDINIGDTIVSSHDIKTKSIIKINNFKQMVFLSIYPIDNKDYKNLEKAIKKLKLNDYSFSYSKDFSNSFGFGFRCGFLGILHFEIIKERILREYNIKIITTIPNVKYKIILKNKNKKFINNPLDLPNKNDISYIEEPYIKITILTYSKYIGKILSYCINKRGIFKNQIYKSLNRIKLKFYIPYSEIIYDFYNQLKSITKGFSSIIYKFIGYKQSNIVKVDIYINYILIDGFSFFAHIDKAFIKAKKLCKQLKELIPKKQFKIPIQAYIYNKIIVREDISPFRKDVTSKCYGGDISRKMKLLNKQKIGKQKMRKIGKIDLPQNIFFSLINIE